LKFRSWREREGERERINEEKKRDGEIKKEH
jgi:hypothetical protein